MDIELILMIIISKITRLQNQPLYLITDYVAELSQEL